MPALFHRTLSALLLCVQLYALFGVLIASLYLVIDTMRVMTFLSFDQHISAAIILYLDVCNPLYASPSLPIIVRCRCMHAHSTISLLTNGLHLSPPQYIRLFLEMLRLLAATAEKKNQSVKGKSTQLM